MARPLRIEYPGAGYHVTSRGNARSMIFNDDPDRAKFLKVFGTVFTNQRWLCHAYRLRGNHQLLIETPEANLSRGMRQLNGIYTQAFNRRPAGPHRLRLYPERDRPILANKLLDGQQDDPVRGDAARKDLTPSF
jgi:REP element-mobilizing transposase RayT